MLQDCEELSLISENSQTKMKKKPIHNFKNQGAPIIQQESESNEHEVVAVGQQEQISGLGEIQNNAEGIDMFTYFREDDQPPQNILIEAEIDPSGPDASYY